MSTIQELIDSGDVVLGETTLRITGTDLRFKPLGKDTGGDGELKWFGVYRNGKLDWRTTTYDAWEVYVPTEDRWQWATASGRESSQGFYAEAPTQPSEKGNRLCVKLEWSRTSFPKGE